MSACLPGLWQQRAAWRINGGMAAYQQRSMGISEMAKAKAAYHGERRNM